MPSRSESLVWLGQLSRVAANLPRAPQPSLYFSQRNPGSAESLEPSLPLIVTRVRALIEEFRANHYFAETLGYSCVDDLDDEGSSPEQELDRRVGKPHLWSQESDSWNEIDLCDFIEVFHDLAAWPTMGWVPQPFRVRMASRELLREIRTSIVPLAHESVARPSSVQVQASQ